MSKRNLISLLGCCLLINAIFIERCYGADCIIKNIPVHCGYIDPVKQKYVFYATSFMANIGSSSTFHNDGINFPKRKLGTSSGNLFENSVLQPLTTKCEDFLKTEGGTPKGATLILQSIYAFDKMSYVNGQNITSGYYLYYAKEPDSGSWNLACFEKSAFDGDCSENYFNIPKCGKDECQLEGDCYN